LGLATTRAADPKYLPNDTEIVFTVNIKQIVESELAKKYKDQINQFKMMLEQAIPGDNQALQYLKKAGIDIYKDVHGVTVAMPASVKPEDGFVLVEGNFDSDKFHEAAEEAAKEFSDALKITRAGANKVLEITPPGENQRLFASLASKNLVIVTGTKEAMTEALGRASGAKRNNLKKVFRSLLDTTTSKQSLSFVATGSAIATLMENVPEGQRKQAEVGINALKNIDGFSGAVTFTKDIQFMLGINSKDAAAAKNLAEQTQKGLQGVQFLIALQAMNNEKLAPLVDVFKTIKVNAQGSNLVIRAQVTPEALEELLKLLPGQ